MLIPKEHPLRVVADEAAVFVHSDRKLDAAKRIIEGCKIDIRLEDDDPAKYVPVLQNWWHLLMNAGYPGDAARFLWSPNQFTPEPKYIQDEWRLFQNNQLGLILGGASCGKSYGMGVRLFMEWVRDPMFTAVRVIGPSEDHLNANLFSDLVRLHTTASIPLPGEIGDRFIGLNRRDETSAILGVVIPLGKQHKAGRVQGSKRKPRVQPHPTFGPLSRLFIFIDEFENVPIGIWKDIDNVISQCGSPPELMDFRLFGAYNPADLSHPVAERAEPPWGWKDFDPDKHYEWISKRGWACLRLDPEKCENVVEGKIVYPGLQTREGLWQIAKNAGGREAPGYLTMGRGAYPLQGSSFSCVPPGIFMAARAEYVWHDEPERVGALDNALEGTGAASLSLGNLGMADGIKYPPSEKHPNGIIVPFKDSNGNHIQRWGLQLDSQYDLEKGDTTKTAGNVVDNWRKAGVTPALAAIDRTGNGAGVADLIRNDWSSAINDVNYSEGLVDVQKIFSEDKLDPSEEYERMATFLWFLTRKWLEFKYLLIAPSVNVSKLQQQVTARLYRSMGKKNRIESKADYKGRGFPSPDEADSLTLLTWAAFKKVGTLSMRLNEPSVGPNSMDEGWMFGAPVGGPGAIIDPTNRSDYLNQSGVN